MPEDAGVPGLDALLKLEVIVRRMSVISAGYGKCQGETLVKSSDLTGQVRMLRQNIHALPGNLLIPVELWESCGKNVKTGRGHGTPVCLKSTQSMPDVNSRR